MFKVIIADDEGFIRRGIIAILKRNITDEIEFWEAGTGAEALSLVQSVRPDLIITDIRMPEVSGLDFIELLRSKNENTAVIIISGYEDFHYAQKAVALGVKKYMTKPVDKQELIDLVSHEFQSRKQHSLLKENEFRQIVASNAMREELRKTLLLELLKEESKEKLKDIFTRLKKMQMFFKATAYTCVIVQYRHDTSLDFIDFSVSNIVQEYLTAKEHIDFVGATKCSKNQIALILSSEETKTFSTDVCQLFSEITRKLIFFYEYDFFCGVGDIVYDAELMQRSFKHAYLAVSYKIFDKQKGIQGYSQLEKGTYLSKEDEYNFTKSLKSLNGMTIIKEFSSFANNPYTQLNMSSFQNMYLQFETELSRCVPIAQIHSTHALKLPNFKNLWSMMDLNQVILKYTTLALEYMSRLNVSPSSQKLLRDILLYIQGHLGEPLDQNLIADVFGRNPSYISSLFKKGMQTGFNEYITQERINLSKKYLKDSSTSISEVASLCGYVNAKYFSVVFKKTTGLTPMEYRESNI